MTKTYPTIPSIETSNFGYFLKQIKQGSLVLEVGTATGYMTKYLKEQRGCKVTGIEIDAESAAQASQYAEKIIVANLDEDPWEKELNGKFDYVLFADVLEHLRYPEKTLQKAIGFLMPGGSVITSIPNIGHNSIILSLKRGRFDYTKYGLLDDTHIHFFTWKGIYEIFQRNGLSCVEEQDNIKRPGKTELKESYFPDLFFSLPLLRRRDGHIYQFIRRWERSEENPTPKPMRRRRVSFFHIPLLCYYDLKDYLSNKHNIHFRLLPQKEKTS